MHIQIEKLQVFEKLWDQGIKPIHSNFRSSVISEIEENIGQKVVLKNVSPETRKNVEDLAKVFTQRTKAMFTSSSVCIIHSISTFLYVFAFL